MECITVVHKHVRFCQPNDTIYISSVHSLSMDSDQQLSKGINLIPTNDSHRRHGLSINQKEFMWGI